MYNEYKEDSIMTEDTRKFVEEKTKEILNAGSCCPELKEMAEKWLAAEGTTDETGKLTFTQDPLSGEKYGSIVRLNSA